MEAKSHASRTWADLIAAAGTSTMVPAVGSPASRQRAANQPASSAVATIGAITHTSAPVASRALARAVSWSVSRSSRSRCRRSPRTPSAGFSSGPRSAKANGLSAPASRVRTTTLRPVNDSNTAV